MGLETLLVAGTTLGDSCGILCAVAASCLFVDDSETFLDAASRLLERGGITVTAVSTGAEALACLEKLEPDITIVDVDLDGESGFDVAWSIARTSVGRPRRVILTSTHSESDYAELVAVTPVLGFISKNDLSAAAVRDFIDDRHHGHGCRHEALVYSSTDELVGASVPFLRQGLAAGEDLLVVLREHGVSAQRAALGDDAARVEFRDSVDWYRSPESSVASYTRYLDEHLGRGVPRVRVVAEVIWPQRSAASEVAGWKHYEAKISLAMASVPVSFICTYDTRELPAEIVGAARQTHPVLRTVEGTWPNASYCEPESFVRSLEREVPELASRS
jgi:two-component system, NarL family, nitrate/nitrite response regulator NarL